MNKMFSDLLSDTGALNILSYRMYLYINALSVCVSTISVLKTLKTGMSVCVSVSG